ncbi:MAG: hypothetical protein ACI9O6_002461 [Glaciecola sp.]
MLSNHHHFRENADNERDRESFMTDIVKYLFIREWFLTPVTQL